MNICGFGSVFRAVSFQARRPAVRDKLRRRAAGDRRLPGLQCVAGMR